MTVTVAGSLNADLIVPVDRLPGRGETVVGRSATTGPGGKGANQAAAAAGLAAGVAMVGRVGDDEAGRRQVAELAGRGVDVSGVRPTPGVPTGAATVAVEQGTGENLIVVAPGANGQVT
ncbi:MAG TPA: PfkB family carbohydrate kinase, partial [Frankiaceae bacterium]